MGEATVATSSDITALQMNPAGLVLATHDAVMASTGTWLVGMKLNFAGASYRLGSGDAIGLAVTSLQSDDMPVTTETQPAGTGEYFRFADLGIGVTYSRRMTDQFSFGLTARYVRETLAMVRLSTIVFDLGTTYRTGLGSTRIGVVVSNFGNDVTPEGTARLFDGSTVTTFQRFSPPTVFKIGLAFDPISDDQQRMTTSVQLNHPNDNAESIRIGAEYAFRDWIFARAGMKQTIGGSLFGEDTRSAERWSLGVGVRVPTGFTDVQFDYSMTEYSVLGTVHRVSVSFEYD